MILISTHAEQDYAEPPRSWLSTAPTCTGAGFTHVALVQVCADPQERFITRAAASCCRSSERHGLASRADQLGVGRVAGRVAQFGTPSPLAGS